MAAAAIGGGHLFSEFFSDDGDETIELRSTIAVDEAVRSYIKKGLFFDPSCGKRELAHQVWADPEIAKTIAHDLTADHKYVIAFLMTRLSQGQLSPTNISSLTPLSRQGDLKAEFIYRAIMHIPADSPLFKFFQFDGRDLVLRDDITVSDGVKEKVRRLLNPGPDSFIDFRPLCKDKNWFQTNHVVECEEGVESFEPEYYEDAHLFMALLVQATSDMHYDFSTVNTEMLQIPLAEMQAIVDQIVAHQPACKG